MNERVVFFADILGFTSLTEDHEIDLAAITSARRPLGPTNIDEIMNVMQNPLTRAFVGFHQAVHWSLRLAELKHPFTAITFSDSLFVATAHLHEAIDLSTDILRSALQREIPLRIGIGYGSFAATHFRSSISDDGGDHAAEFLGKAVVRAHSAEGCGIKGMRILLHPSTEALLTKDDEGHSVASRPDLRILSCTEEEQNNRAGVRLEVDYWSFGKTAEGKAWHALQDMWKGAPDQEGVHYRSTAAAINRMRVARGEPSLVKLQRRTLPRNTVEAE